MTRPAGASANWATAVTAVSLLAIDPISLGGLRLRGPADQARERLLAIYAALLPESAPVRKLPLAIADARLLGGLDLTATLSSGRPVMQRGLLAEADRGALIISGVERMPPGLAGRLALAMDSGTVAVERDGFASILAARFAVVACDEALPGDEAAPAALAERLGLAASLAGSTRDDLSAPPPDPAAIAAARARLAEIVVSDEGVQALAEAAEKLGVIGLRALLFASAAARASAALGGRNAVDQSDLALAARLVLGPRARQASHDQRRAPEEAPEPGDQGEVHDQSEADEEAGGDPRELAEQVFAAAAAVLPADLLQRREPASRGPRAQGTASGKVGAKFISLRRGRPVGARSGLPENGARLDLVETLRAAAPWQRLRRGARLLSPSALARDGGGSGLGEGDERRASRPTSPHPAVGGATFCHTGRKEERVLVRREDFRIKRLKARSKTVTIFVVDASGSAAMHRLAEAKGAVELLLADCYVRRDEAALIAFRGQDAAMVLPPTRSLARAKRALAGLAGGGGTPLGLAIEAGALLADSVKRRGDTPMLVFLTDGQANIARDGTGGRGRAQDEAACAARALKALDLATLVIDVSPRPNLRAKDLADAMAARYVPLPAADAGAVSRVISAVA